MSITELEKSIIDAITLEEVLDGWYNSKSEGGVFIIHATSFWFDKSVSYLEQKYNMIITGDVIDLGDLKITKKDNAGIDPEKFFWGGQYE